MEIKHPRRMLVLGSPNTDISRVIKGWTDSLHLFHALTKTG
jgi:hypothetical protein